MSAHAILSASGSKKWLVCTPSARLEEKFPNETSEYAEEGTFAHELFELEMRLTMGDVTTKEYRRLLTALKTNPFYTEELYEAVLAAAEVARARIREVQATCRDPAVLIEARLDFSTWVPQGFGTGDLVIVADGTLDVMDYKHGKGVRVEAKGNSQMRLYGLGAYHELCHLYDIERIRTTVLQPRQDNYESEELTLSELLHWATDVVVPAAKLAWRGEGEFVAGDHCSSGFCRARYQCAARADSSLALAREDFALKAPELLSAEQITKVLTIGDEVAKWIADVQAYALERARDGATWQGFKMVEGRSNRKYINQELVAARLIERGVPEASIYERSLLGITAMEKMLGKKKFGELVGDLVEKPAGRPTLVREDDKRPALNSPAEDFAGGDA